MKKRELEARVLRQSGLRGMVAGLMGFPKTKPGRETDFDLGHQLGTEARRSLLTAAREQQTREQEPARFGMNECREGINYYPTVPAQERGICDRCGEYVDQCSCPAQEPVEDEDTAALYETQMALQDAIERAERAERERDEAQAHYRATNDAYRKESARAEAAEHERDELRAAIERHRKRRSSIGHGLSPQPCDLDLWAVLSKEEDDE